MIIYVIYKNGGDDNSPYSLNVMVNYHYHSENRAITPVIPIYAEKLVRLFNLTVYKNVHVVFF